MILGAIGDTGYNVVLLLHILAAIVAFAPAFVNPLLVDAAKDDSPADRTRLYSYFARNGRRVYAPALLLTGLLGFALQGMSDGLWKFSQGWLAGAAIVWIAMNGVVHGMILPGEKAVADGDASGEQRVQIGGMVVTVLLVVMLYLMVFKPGF